MELRLLKNEIAAFKKKELPDENLGKYFKPYINRIRNTGDYLNTAISSWASSGLMVLVALVSPSLQ